MLNKVLKMSDNEERASLLQQGVNYIVERLQIYFQKICCNRLTCFLLSDLSITSLIVTGKFGLMEHIKELLRSALRSTL